MKYILCFDCGRKVPEFEISKEEFNEFDHAYKVLTKALAIEEIYDILITNYFEFEKQIFDNTANLMLRSQHNSHYEFVIAAGSAMVQKVK